MHALPVDDGVFARLLEVGKKKLEDKKKRGKATFAMGRLVSDEP